MSRQYRQGDVLLCPIERIPPEAYRLRHEGNRVIVADGELSGHAHAFAAKGVWLFRDKRNRRSFLSVGQNGAELRHEEHAPIAVAPGYYEIRQQREYAPRSSQLRRD